MSTVAIQSQPGVMSQVSDAASSFASTVGEYAGRAWTCLSEAGAKVLEVVSNVFSKIAETMRSNPEYTWAAGGAAIGAVAVTAGLYMAFCPHSMFGGEASSTATTGTATATSTATGTATTASV